MSEVPKVSIILPVYNSAPYLKKCIQSVLNQTEKDFELLVINDGSTDDSLAVINTFSDKRISIYTKPNGGLSDARNFGMDRATGTFLYFLDADDWVEPNLLSDNLAVLEAEKLPFLIFGYFNDYFNEGKYQSTREVTPKGITNRRGDQEVFVDGNQLDLMGYAWNKIYRRDFLKSFHPRFEKGTNLIEDVLFNFEVFKHADVVKFVPHSYYHYINRQKSSLLKTFHVGSFELIKRRALAIQSWLDNWEAKNEFALTAYSLISGIRYCVFNLFGCENKLSDTEKKDYIRKMFEDEMTRKALLHFIPDDEGLLLYQTLIENKMVEETYKMGKKQNPNPYKPLKRLVKE